MRPFLFLDIDGVLATSHQFNTNRKKWHDVYDCYRFDEKCVKVFNNIVQKTDPIIILSSDWKDNYSIEQMNMIFEWNGMESKVTDFTGSLWGIIFKSVQELEECRAFEILKYVDDHNIKNWVAVDDLDLSPWIENNFVRTPRINEGIKQSGVKEKILNIIKNE